MSDTIDIRLVGGPFDGDRDRAAVDDAGDPPPRLWVRRCAVCRDTHWEDHPGQGQGGDVYRRDCEEDGWHVYIFTDERLGDGLKESVREVVPAGMPEPEPEFA